MSGRLFIISNRLPINIEQSADKIQVNASSGGLITAISGYLKNAEENNFTENYWVGVPSCSASVWAKAEDNIQSNEYNYLPVFINKKPYEQYYNGFSNSVIWPLFHYFPSYAEFSKDHYESYLHCNKIFLDVILNHAKPTDTIWIHDYHLMPLANMIREHIPGITIGFFLHIPFPSFEIFRIMPKAWQEEILKGMLGADLIGFHTIDYADHFLRCVQMILGLDNEMHVLRYKDRLVKIDVFPISIDYDKYHNAFDNKKVTKLRNNYKQQFENKKVIFSVDRLDYTKGVYNRLKAFEYFLLNYPEYKEKVAFILVVVPSRDSISKYAERKKMIDEYISHINSSIGTINWQPVIYQYTNLEFEELLAMYTYCNLALITPLRDGMNLVAKEFVASRKDGKGVLILSEMAGAVRELTEALTINPHDIEEIAANIKAALVMDEKEQQERILTMQDRIKNYDVNMWATDFLTQLRAIKIKQKEFEIRFVDYSTKQLLVDNYQKASDRLLLLDYDGTLLPFSSNPGSAIPDNTLIDLLTRLSESKRNTIYIISGRDSSTLDKWLGHLPINLIAEHGARFKTNGKGWDIDPKVDNEWKDNIEKIMKSYAVRCAYSFVETKSFSVAWHYRNANPDQAKLRAAELYVELSGYTNNLGLQIILGNKVIEVRNKGVDKGAAVKKVIHDHAYDFILACGDDTTDEDMFRELAPLPQAFTIKIGGEASFAKYNLHTSHMVISLLDLLSTLKNHKISLNA